jgi:hypothetical protein
MDGHGHEQKARRVTNSDVESRLRAALRARAELVTHASLRPMPVPGSATAASRTPVAGAQPGVVPPAPVRPTRPARRRRWVWAVVPVAAAAMFGIGLFAGRGLWPSSHSSNQTPAGTPKASATPGGNATSQPLTNTTFDGIRLEVPKNWSTVVDSTDPTEKLCVYPTGEHGCAGADALTIWLVPQQPSDSPLSGSGFMNQPYGWEINSPAPTCPDGSDALSSKVIDGDYPKLADGHTAQYTQWLVSCSSGQSVMPLAWWLPTSRVLIYNTTQQNDNYLLSYKAIVQSLNLTELHPPATTTIPITR